MQLADDAILRVGEVCAVDGRRIFVLVDRDKNLSDMFLHGDLLKNISVNSYIEIRKGFLRIIGRVEGEKIEEVFSQDRGREPMSRDRRILTVALSGYIDESGTFIGGTKELPLIGNEAYIVTREVIHLVHNLVGPGALSINIATVFGEEFDVHLPIDGLFNSHIAIFGNTGSGKSNTLAALYQEVSRVLHERNPTAFANNTRFVVFDFNGEYVGPHCICDHKKVYNLSTREGGDRLPLPESALIEVEVLSILTDATERTQRPFLKRTLRLYRRIHQDPADAEDFLRNLVRARIRDALQMSDKVRALLILDYLREILPPLDDDHGNPIDLAGDLDWHNQSQGFVLRVGNTFLQQHPDSIADARIYQRVDHLTLDSSLVSRLITFLYIQLISDIISNRAQNEHIAPVINRLKSRKHDIDQLFDLGADDQFWASNVVVVNLDNVNLEMKKTLPLLLAKRLYAEHKLHTEQKTLTFIIDEAHNILSKESFRESESWKDYRLETFEEIVKEGRKFGVFVTISSQRPNDISPTITSQAHHYFIHRLINDLDLRTIASAVSYIDRVTEESIPTLPTGTCVFSGVVSQVPLKINVKPLSEAGRPQSATRQFGTLVPAQ